MLFFFWIGFAILIENDSTSRKLTADYTFELKDMELIGEQDSRVHVNFLFFPCFPFLSFFIYLLVDPFYHIIFIKANFHFCSKD